MKPVCQINFQGTSLPLVHSEIHHPLPVVKISDLRHDITGDSLFLKPNLLRPPFDFGFEVLEFDNDSVTTSALHPDTSPHILNKFLEVINFQSFVIKPEGDWAPFDAIRKKKRKMIRYWSGWYLLNQVRAIERMSGATRKLSILEKGRVVSMITPCPGTSLERQIRQIQMFNFIPELLSAHSRKVITRLFTSPQNHIEIAPNHTLVPSLVLTFRQLQPKKRALLNIPLTVYTREKSIIPPRSIGKKGKRR